MANLFKAFLFRLRHDLTFKITLIVGIGLAIFLSLIYLLIDLLTFEEVGYAFNGVNMLLSSFSPTQNFGLAVPVNLITFTILEFNQGSIRNKIIAGHSKAKLYVSIFLTGLIFAFALITIYSLLCFGIGSIAGGVTGKVDPESPVVLDGTYVWKMIIIAIVSYVSVVSFTVFFSTLFRNIGPSIPVVIVGLVLCSTTASLMSILSGDNETLLTVMKIIDPLYALSTTENIDGVIDGVKTVTKTVTNFTFISGIISNLCYAAIFFVGGLLIFKRRDIK